MYVHTFMHMDRCLVVCGRCIYVWMGGAACGGLWAYRCMCLCRSVHPFMWGMYLWDGEGVAVCVHRNNYIMNHLYKNWSPIQICRYENQSACISVGSVPVRVPPTPVTQAAVLSPAGVMVQILSGEDSRCLLPECAGYMHRKGLVTPLQAQILF